MLFLFLLYEVYVLWMEASSSGFYFNFLSPFRFECNSEENEQTPLRNKTIFIEEIPSMLQNDDAERDRTWRKC